MTFLFKSESESERPGSSAYRQRTERFFHVMNLGWFVYTREADALETQHGIELREGVIGPFETRNRAVQFLHDHLISNKADSSGESWRYE